MKLAIVGTRTFNDYKLLKETIESIPNIDLIISGGCSGADRLAEVFAKENNIPMRIFRAEWDKYGKAAGPIRNRFIIKECDECVAFWDGKSRGTLNDINICKELNKKVTIIKF